MNFLPTTPTYHQRPVILNPLPVALAHYEQALQGHLDAPLEVVTASIETDGLARFRRLRRRVRASIEVIRHELSRGPIITIWPAFGLAEIALSRLSRGARLIIIHDPVPLRKQVGYARLGRLLGRWGSRGRSVQVVTHTELAADALRQMGVRVHRILPHPILRVERSNPSESVPHSVLVAGQFKTARDTELLKRLPEYLGPGWDLRIHGRGWPAVPGWKVDSRFLNEEELDRAISTAGVVLIPYTHYFQSGIATRALELGTAVVARRHEFIEQLFGVQWVGLVDGNSARAWSSVLETVVRTSPRAPTSTMATADMEWQDACAGLAEHSTTGIATCNPAP